MRPRSDRAVMLPYAAAQRHARLRRMVIDRGVIIPEGLVAGENPEEDANWVRVTDKGVTLVTQGMLDRRVARL